MKKIIITILLFLLFIPFIVNAEECDQSSISIVSMEQKDISGNTEVISDPEYEGRSISLNLKMYDVNDSISYDLVIKNDSDENFVIDEDSFKTDSNYIEYTLTSEDGTNVVKANSTKEMVLGVIYKTEVNSSDYDNNIYNASNTLTLALNTNEKEKNMDTISTDNIKNPNTKVNSLIVISIVLLIATIIMIIKANKVIDLRILVLFFCITSIPVAYAICKSEIEVESSIQIEKKDHLFDKLISYTSDDNTCIVKYEGDVTDEVGHTVAATNVYFDKCENQRNVIFAGFCWQVIRTTETGGTKLLYNGEPVDGKCEKNRPDHKGIIGASGVTQAMDSEYVYGDSFTYDTTTGEFKLTNPTTATWSDSTYENILSKFTCKSDSDTCTTMYQINSYDSNTKANLSSYTIGDTNSIQIGKSPFNIDYQSPAMHGYMFNKTYKYNKKIGNGMYGTFVFGSSFTYDESTNTYTLTGTTQITIAMNTDYNEVYSQINNAHYTCWNTTGSCQTISYIYGSNASNTIGTYYYNISGGKGINDILNEMLYDDDVNRYNSSIKGIIDAWYMNNLTDYTNRLEDAVYCQARNIGIYNGFDPNGGDITKFLQFKKTGSMKDLSCELLTDQFNMSNNKAKLKYPVALFQREELLNLNRFLFLTTDLFWILSPTDFYGSAHMNIIGGAADEAFYYTSGVYSSYAVRPVITLNNKNVIDSGTGSETDPWIIK